MYVQTYVRVCVCVCVRDMHVCIVHSMYVRTYVRLLARTIIGNMRVFNASYPTPVKGHVAARKKKTGATIIQYTTIYELPVLPSNLVRMCVCVCVHIHIHVNIRIYNV
jgi:hypothetical protein